MIASFTNRLTYTMIAKPEIKKAEDLRNKRFGVQAIGGSVWMGAVLGLEHLGLMAEQGYRDLVQISDPKPYVSLEGIRNIQRLIKIQNPIIGNVKVDDLIDNRPLKKLEDSGFLQRTYNAYGFNR